MFPDIIGDAKFCSQHLHYIEIVYEWTEICFNEVDELDLNHFIQLHFFSTWNCADVVLTTEANNNTSLSSKKFAVIYKGEKPDKYRVDFFVECDSSDIILMHLSASPSEPSDFHVQTKEGRKTQKGWLILFYPFRENTNRGLDGFYSVLLYEQGWY